MFDKKKIYIYNGYVDTNLTEEPGKSSFLQLFQFWCLHYLEYKQVLSHVK
jgi:hypothetical protein